MRKKFLIPFAVMIVGTIFFVGCTSSKSNDSNSNNITNSSSTTSDKNVNEKVVQTVGIDEFEKLLAEQPLYVSSTEYFVQSQGPKILFPDMLQAIITSNSTEDIKDAVVAFVAWDNNNLPVKIQNQFDFGGGSYVKQVNYKDINLVNGASYGENGGYELDENSNISKFKAIVVSYETFDGNVWKNPYYENFKTTYEGKKYSDDMKFEVKIDNNNFSEIEQS